MAPSGHLHLLPLAESVKPEFQQPVRFSFQGGDRSYDVLVQAFRNKILADVRHESFLVLLRGDPFNYLVFFSLIHRQITIMQR